VVKLDGKEINVTISANTKPFKDGLKIIKISGNIFQLSIALRKLRESIENFKQAYGKLIKELEEGKQNG